MISFANKDRRESVSKVADGQSRHYLWVCSAIFLSLGFLIIGKIGRTLAYVSDKLEVGFPFEYWWVAIDVRACAWLVLVPLLAAIIVDRRSNLWQTALLHLALLTVAVLVSGNFLHRYAHIQSDQLNHLIDAYASQATSSSESVSATGSDNSGSNPVAVKKDNVAKNYENVTFHNSYGFGYWLGEFIVIFTTYLMMNAIGYAVLYFRITLDRTRQADQLRHTLTQLQHESLCNRLTPHFLFNTLNTISSLTLTDGMAARTCISQLGELLRESLDSLPVREIRLDKEIDILRTYLTIQKMRFGSTLDYSIDVEDGLEAAMVPAFVLQPLVENSFKHGFHENVEVARVSISAKRDGASCRLEVSDNGAKIDPAEILDEKYGLGLTRQRLHLQYEHSAQILYEPNLPSGLKVIVLVPLQVRNGELQ